MTPPELRALAAELKTEIGSHAWLWTVGIGDDKLFAYVFNPDSARAVVPAEFRGVPVELKRTGRAKAE